MNVDRVRLQPWTEADLAVELRNNAEDMTTFLGGPQAEEVVRGRHERFLRGQADGTISPFTVRSDAVDEPVGAAAYWQIEHHGEAVYECGWFIFVPFQRRGYAQAAVRLLLEHAASRGDRDTMLAFPRVDNAASNALARSAGFVNTGVEDSEYPKGVPITVNAWAFDLRALR
ncbi:GNAT family N-acetyltransferase [Leifsonia sp. EB34]|uniref:GNAT family N-acetyltransferase n=1 Tax=Leifsonia sp. EB34 TaxID=3156303 RepID=UPI003518CCDB